MGNKEFYSIIWGYHKQIYSFPQEQNYHLHPLAIAKKLGYTPYIISLDELDPPEGDPNIPKDIPILRFRSVGKYLSFLFQKKDAYFYVNSLTLKTLIVGMIVKHSIFIPHDSIFGSSWIKERIIRFFYRFFTRIRVNHDAEVRAINTIKKNLAIAIPLVIDSHDMRTPNDSQSSFTLLSLGNLIPKKHPELLLSALKKTKDLGYKFKLITLGDDRLKKNGYTRDYKEMIIDYKLSEQVDYLGYIPATEALEHITKAHVYVNTSSQEGLCIALYESILKGLGVIIPDILSFAGVFGDDAYIYPGGDEEALVRTLIKAYDERQYRSEKVVRMQKTIKENYNYSRISSSLEELFVDVYEK